VFLKSFQVDERWYFDYYSYLCKGLIVYILRSIVPQQIKTTI
jgi:hypothetical protein